MPLSETPQERSEHARRAAHQRWADWNGCVAETGMKICTSCNVKKALSEFGAAGDRPYGRSHCRSCRAAKAKAKYSDPAEQAKKAAHYLANRERKLVATRANYRANFAREHARRVARHKAHPEQSRDAAQRRRARLNGREVERFSDLEIFDRDGWVCQICGQQIHRELKRPHPASVSLDHVIPIALGGNHTRANVQASHLQCNLRKARGTVSLAPLSGG